jgi:hypothetical protein
LVQGHCFRLIVWWWSTVVFLTKYGSSSYPVIRHLEFLIHRTYSIRWRCC